MLADRSLGVPHVSRFSRRGYSHCRHPRDLSLDWGKAPTSGDDDDEDAVLVSVNGRGGEIQRLVVQAVCCALLESARSAAPHFGLVPGDSRNQRWLGRRRCAPPGAHHWLVTNKFAAYRGDRPLLERREKGRTPVTPGCFGTPSRKNPGLYFPV